MLCEKCGKILSEGVKFCDSCGTPVKVAESVHNEAPQQSAPQQSYTQQPYTQQTYTQQPYTQQSYTSGFNPMSGQKGEPVSVGGFIGRNLIPLIPFVGAFIYLILLFVWAGDKTKEETFRNWAKAQLWIMLIGVVIAVIVGIIVAAGIVAGGSSIYNNYYDYMY